MTSTALAAADDGDDRRSEPELVEVAASAVLVPVDQKGDDQLIDDPTVDVDGKVGDRPATRPPAAPRPVLPSWVKSWPAFVDAAIWWLRHPWHVTAFHGIRLPLYWLRLLARAPFGV